MDEDDLPRVPFLDRLGDGARASLRRARSPARPAHPDDDDATAPAPDATTATLLPALWADRDPAAETRARAHRARGPKRKSTTPLDDALARALAAVAARDGAPPSHFDRWRRILDDAERPLARAATRDVFVAGPETALPALPARPAPSLTWDQHHVFLQYPPTRRRVAAELPRGLTPALLAELYRSVEREQRRYMAHLDAVARANPDGGASYLTVGPVRVARAEEVARAREVRRGLARAPRFVSVSRVDGGDVSLVAARLARLEPVHFERLESGSGVEPTPAPVPLPPDAFPRRGDRLAEDAAAALEATGEAAGEGAEESPSPVASASSALASRDGVPLDAALTSRAFACLAGNAPGRFHRAWDVPVTIVAAEDAAEDGSKIFPGRFHRVVVDDPLPSRDAAAATVRARTAAVYETAIRARCVAKGARPTRLRGVFLLGSLRVAVASADAYAEGDDPAAPTRDARCKPEYRRKPEFRRRADDIQTDARRRAVGRHRTRGGFVGRDGVLVGVSGDATARVHDDDDSRRRGGGRRRRRRDARRRRRRPRAGADAPPPPPHLPLRARTIHVSIRVKVGTEAYRNAPFRNDDDAEDASSAEDAAGGADREPRPRARVRPRRRDRHRRARPRTTPRVRTGTVRPLARVGRDAAVMYREANGGNGGTRETRRDARSLRNARGSVRVGAGAGRGGGRGRRRGGRFRGSGRRDRPPGEGGHPPGEGGHPPGEGGHPRAADPASKAGALRIRASRLFPRRATRTRTRIRPWCTISTRRSRWPPPIRIARMFRWTCSLPRSRRSGRFDARSRRGGNRRSPARENREKCGRHSSPRPATTGTGTGFGTESTPRIATSSIGEAAAARGRAGRTKAAAPAPRARCAAPITP